MCVKLQCGRKNINWNFTNFGNGILTTNFFSFLAAHTLLLAHGKAWHVYDEEFRKTQKGRVSIVLNADWHFPEKNEDVFLEAAERGMEFFLGWFANPIYVNGDYPEVMKTLIAKHSKMEGIPNRYTKTSFERFYLQWRPFRKVNVRHKLKTTIIVVQVLHFKFYRLHVSEWIPDNGYVIPGLFLGWGHGKESSCSSWSETILHGAADFLTGACIIIIHTWSLKCAGLNVWHSRIAKSEDSYLHVHRP